MSNNLKEYPIKLPKIGLGTYLLSPKQAATSVIKGLDIGYRMIDTAQIYKNEEGVGEGIEASWVNREQYFLATKIWIWNYSPSKLIKSAMKSLKKLHTDYVDILYLHWPAKFFYKPEKTLKALEQLVKDGYVKYIGVSNFNEPLIEQALSILEHPILANQVEHHPLLQQKKLRNYLNQKKIYLVAYSPLIRANLNLVPEIMQISNRIGNSPAQVTLAWEIAHGAIPIPKATGETHLRDNFESQKLQLNPEDIQKIDAITTEKRMLDYPLLRPNW